MKNGWKIKKELVYMRHLVLGVRFKIVISREWLWKNHFFPNGGSDLNPEPSIQIDGAIQRHFYGIYFQLQCQMVNILLLWLTVHRKKVRWIRFSCSFHFFYLFLLYSLLVLSNTGNWRIAKIDLKASFNQNIL